MRALLCLALLLPVAAAAKAKVVLDAPRPIAPAIEKALKAKYSLSKQSLATEPTGGDVKAACREAGGAIAVVTARQGADLYTVMVLNGADGSPLATFRVKGGKKPVKALSKPDVKKLLEGLSDAKAPRKEKDSEAAKPPPEESKPDEKKPPDERAVAAEKPPDEKPRRDKDRPPPSEPPPAPSEEVRESREEEPDRSSKPGEKPIAIRVGAGFKMFTRQFGYTDDIFDRLSTYYLPRGPALALDVELFPGALLGSGPASYFGILASFDYAVGIASRAEDGTRYGTTALNVRVALAGRIPISILTVQPFFGFARQVYSISSSTGVKPNIPSVGYNGLRYGLNLRLKIFGPVSFQAGLAGLALLSTGEIGAFFPRSKANAFDVNAFLSIAALDHLEVRIGGEYQRYWFSMNSEPGDNPVAGGALDVYGSGTVSLAFTF